MTGSLGPPKSIFPRSISSRRNPTATTSRSSANSFRQLRASAIRLTEMTRGFGKGLSSFSLTHSRNLVSQSQSLGRLQTTPISIIISLLQLPIPHRDGTSQDGSRDFIRVFPRAAPETLG